MRAYLNNGPAHGREINVSPGTTEYRVAIPLPVDILNPFPYPGYIADAMPNYDVALYRFMGTGFVNLDGACTALIFQYEGTSHA
jgi:hypothetical protein